jgi:hypothetical protein
VKERLSPIGFWSYARQDDEASQGRLSSLRTVLSAELQQQYGRDPIKIFQDVAAIPPGAEWEQKIREALNDSTFFIPLITPNFVQSQWCSEEFFVFREREIQINETYPSLRNERRIFPIYYVNIDGVEAYDSKLIEELKRLQWLDFTRLRLKDHNQEAVREKVSELAGSLRRLLHARAVEGALAQEVPGTARAFTPTKRTAVDPIDHGAVRHDADHGSSAKKRKPANRLPLLIGASVVLLALAAGGAYVMMRHGGGGEAAQAVSFAKAARISAFPATVIDADTSDALWGDATDAGPAGFALASTAGSGAAETAAVYLLTDADHPPVSWTGPVGSRGSAILIKGSQAWTGGDQGGQALIQALSISNGAMTEGWRRMLGAGRVMGLASAGERLLACVQTSAGAGASSRVAILQTDGTPTATYAPAATEGQIELHRVIGVGDGGGVAVGWITGASTPGGAPPQSLFAARFGADGHELWRRVIAQPGKLIRANAVAADEDGLEVVGWRRDVTNGAFYQGVVETLDMNSGTVKGERIVRRSGSVLLRAVQPAAGDALFVSGVAFDNYLTDKGGGWLVAEIDKDGRILDSDWNLTPDRHQIAEALAWKPGTGLLAFGFSAAGDRSTANPAAALYPAKAATGH